MQMENLTRTLAAQGGVMKQFAKFMDSAPAEEMEPLEKALKHFNRSRGDDKDFVYSAFYMLTLHLALSAGKTREDADVDADNLASHFNNAVYVLFKEAPEPEIRLLSTFLGRLHEPEPSEARRPRKDVLTIMREISADWPAGYPYPDNKYKHLLWLLRKSDRPFVLTYAGPGGATKTMNLSRSEAAEAAKLMEPIMKGVKSWEDEMVDMEAKIKSSASLPKLAESVDTAEYPDLSALIERVKRLSDDSPACKLVVLDAIEEDDDVSLTKPEFFAAIDAIKRMRAGTIVEGAPPADLEHGSEDDEEDEPVIDAATVLERKFDEFKEAQDGPVKTTIMVFDPSQGIAEDCLHLTEAEFRTTIDRIRRERRGEGAPGVWVKRIVTAIFRPHDSLKEKPLVEAGELIPDPDLMDEAFTAIRKAIASVKPHTEAKEVPEDESASNPEAEALVDEMVGTFGKLRAAIARQKETQPQE